VLTPMIGGVFGVAAGSLAGRAARTVTAYIDIELLMRREDRGMVPAES